MAGFYTNFKLYGNTILLREVGSDGHRYNRRVNNFEPQLFEPGHPTAATDIFGNSLKAIHCDSIKQAKALVEQRSGVSGISIYGYDKWANQYVAQRYDSVKIRTDWDVKKISVAHIDIETDVEYGFPDVNDPCERINLISFHESITNRMYCFSLLESTIHREETDVMMFKCENEQELLVKFIQVWERLAPDVITGWNIERFDIPYIVNRIKRLAPDSEMYLRLSPWKLVSDRTVHTKFGEYQTYDFGGISTLDHMLVYQKLNRERQSSYSLDHIAAVELNDEKLKHHSGIAGHLLYNEYPDDAVRYNIKDVRLLIALEEKKNLLRTVMIIAYNSMTNYSDVLSQIRMWDNILYKELADKAIQFKITKDKNRSVPFDGAYVKPTITGRHDWVVSFDVTSMYPSLIRALNISPEKIAELRIKAGVDAFLYNGLGADDYAAGENLCIGANGVCFTKDMDGFMPQVVRKMFDDRQQYKYTMIDWEKKTEAAKVAGDKTEAARCADEAKRYDLLQNSIKVQLNSLYGATGNQFFRFYDVRMSEAITMTGQLLIKWIARDINDFVNKISKTEGVDYCVASDTDSLYVNFGTFVKTVLPGETDKTKILDALDQFASKKVQPLINASFARLAGVLNCSEPAALSMKREAIADVTFFTAKKSYLARVLDNEGVRYEKGKIKAIGLDSAKSSTPAVARKWLKELYPILFDGTEAQLQEKMKAYEKEYHSMPADKLAKSTSVSDVSTWDNDQAGFAKGIPYQCRAAVVHNREIRKQKLTSDYPLLKNGDKIYLSYLVKPNRFNSDLIGWAGNAPKEFDLEKHIDRDVMWDKVMITAVERISKLQNWSAKKVSNLDAFGF